MPSPVAANSRSQLSRILSNTGCGVGDRAADDLQHRGRRRLLLERLLGLVEEARVLDRDHRLVGEGAQQPLLLVVERAQLRAADQDRADRLAFPEHRRERRPNTSPRAARRSGAAPPELAGSFSTSEYVTRRRSRIACSLAVPASGTGKMRRVRSIRSASGPRIAPSTSRSCSSSRKTISWSPLNRRSQPCQDLVEHRRRVGDRVADRLQHLGRWRSAARALPWSR